MRRARRRRPLPGRPHRPASPPRPAHRPAHRPAAQLPVKFCAVEAFRIAALPLALAVAGDARPAHLLPSSRAAAAVTAAAEAYEIGDDDLAALDGDEEAADAGLESGSGGGVAPQ